MIVCMSIDWGALCLYVCTRDCKLGWFVHTVKSWFYRLWGYIHTYIHCMYEYWHWGALWRMYRLLNLLWFDMSIFREELFSRSCFFCVFDAFAVILCIQRQRFCSSWSLIMISKSISKVRKLGFGLYSIFEASSKCTKNSLSESPFFLFYLFFRIANNSSVIIW